MAEGSTDRPDDVCRDFLRNVCNRGKKCKYTHPTNVTQSPVCLIPQQERLNFCGSFCHDYQNAECKRDDCKFLHCSKEEQKIFLETGKIPGALLEDAISKSVTPCLPGESPVCKEYLNGECRRGKNCKYRHLSHCNYRKELNLLFGAQSSPLDSCSYSQPKRMKLNPCLHPVENQCMAVSHGCNQSKHECNGLPARQYPPCQNIPVTSNCCEHAQVLQDHHLFSNNLQEENADLKKQVSELRRQLSSLITANEFLLEQNATLRMIHKNGGMVQTSQSASAPIAVPVSIAPVTGPGPGLTLSTMAMAGATATQALVPVSCHAPGQQILPVTVGAQTGSPALLATAVPVSVSNSASQLVVPVSLATVSMAPVHMPPMGSAPTPQETPHSMALTVSAASSLVSYPYVTHQSLLPTR